MKLMISHSDFAVSDVYVDRDGFVSCNSVNNEQGFNVGFDEFTIHFELETDAALLANKILRRMGKGVIRLADLPKLPIGEMVGVTESGEGRPVTLEMVNGRLEVCAQNEGGHSGTGVDLLQLLRWIERGGKPE